MADKKQAGAKVGRSQNVFSTKGGRSYLDNLQRLHPTDLTRKAIERVEESGRAKERKDH